MDMLQDTLDRLDLGVARFDRELRLVAWNRRFLDMFEYPRRLAAEGTPFLDFVHFNIDRGEHGSAPRDRLVADRLARLTDRYRRHRPDGTVLAACGRRLEDGGVLKLFEPVATAPGAPRLTPREVAAVEWAARGKTVEDTALLLGVAARTVEFHLTNAAAKLGAPNKARLVALAVRAGLVEP